MKNILDQAVSIGFHASAAWKYAVLLFEPTDTFIKLAELRRMYR